MKKLFSILLIAATLLSVMSCDRDGLADQNSIYLLHYSKGKTTSYIGYGTSSSNFKIALKFDAATIAEKGNKQIIGIRFDVNIVEGGTVFVANELGNNIVEKEFTYTEGGWQYVMFDAPIKIEKELDYYIGYDITSSGYPIGYEEVKTSAKHCTNSYMNRGNSGWKTFKSDGLAGYGACIQAICIGGDYSKEYQHDVIAENLDVKQNFRAGDVVNFSAEIRNAGIKTTGDIDVTCTYGSEKVVEKVSGLRNGESKVVNFTIDGIGLDVNKITVNAIESEVDDAAPSNNKVTKNVAVYAADAPERVCILIEEFTSQSCPNCPDGIATLREAIAGMQHPEKAAWVAHHSGYQNDIFTLKGDLTIASKLGVYSAPDCIIDRMAVDYGRGVSEFDWHPAYATSALLDDLTSTPANATIAMNVSLQDSTLTVDVNGMSYPNDCYITVLLCQNGIKAAQSYGGDNFLHNEVIRAYLTSAEGDKLTLDGDKNYSAHFEYHIPATIKGETSAGKATATDIPNMYVVAFVHGKTSSKSAVYNAIKANIINE